eukprot:GILI01003880.1.p1 GENE.GILI01003880.1~~GILI01003880.1.p1  ORF type:complete len:518 (+),score=129.17 GILI01003880.1:99-1556(+)
MSARTASRAVSDKPLSDRPIADDKSESKERFSKLRATPTAAKQKELPIPSNTSDVQPKKGWPKDLESQSTASAILESIGNLAGNKDKTPDDEFIDIKPKDASKAERSAKEYLADTPGQEQDEEEESYDAAPLSFLQNANAFFEQMGPVLSPAVPSPKAEEFDVDASSDSGSEEDEDVDADKATSFASTLNAIGKGITGAFTGKTYEDEDDEAEEEDASKAQSSSDSEESEQSTSKEHVGIFENIGSFFDNMNPTSLSPQEEDAEANSSNDNDSDISSSVSSEYNSVLENVDSFFEQLGPVFSPAAPAHTEELQESDESTSSDEESLNDSSKSGGGLVQTFSDFFEHVGPSNLLDEEPSGEKLSKKAKDAKQRNTDDEVAGLVASSCAVGAAAWTIVPYTIQSSKSAAALVQALAMMLGNRRPSIKKAILRRRAKSLMVDLMLVVPIIIQLAGSLAMLLKSFIIAMAVVIAPQNTLKKSHHGTKNK